MRSFANYRWILAITVVVAVLAVFFYRPRVAWAGPDGNNPQGGKAKPCSKGTASANYKGKGADCASCVVVTTKTAPGATPPPPAADNDDDEPEDPISGNPRLMPGFNGTATSPAGSTSQAVWGAT